MNILENVTKFLVRHQEQKIEQKKEKEEKQFNDKVDDVCDNGSIEDLLDLKRK